MKMLVALVLAAVAAGAACGSGIVERASVRIAPDGDPQLSRIAEAVNAALMARPPRGRAAIPREIQLLAVDRRRDGTIALDFNEALLMGTTPETLEDVLDQILTAAAPAAEPSGSSPAVRVLVEGVAVDSYRPAGPLRPSS